MVHTKKKKKKTGKAKTIGGSFVAPKNISFLKKVCDLESVTERELLPTRLLF